MSRILDPKRIFVSWSGERSKSAALGLKSLLLDVLGESLDVFISAHMEPGVVWVQELGKESLLNSGAQFRANILALPKAETAHLLNLRDRPQMVYIGGDSVKKEMRMLRDLGLISNTQPIASLPNEFTLKDRFALTETGRQYVETISPSSANATQE